MTSIYNLIILDESGSMQPLKSAAVSGYNEIVQTILNSEREFPDQRHFVTFITFNGSGIKVHLDKARSTSLKLIDESLYQPNASTPLYDAIGTGIENIRPAAEESENTKVLATIITDGMENASREYNRSIINSLISQLSTAGWTFTYIGSNHNVDAAADRISIKNKSRFKNTDDGMKAMYMMENKARSRYYEKISKNEKINDSDFFEEK